ncbi:hypothetical protein B0H14DRAFT_196403 [Mycena olivaceomarginata]|nr:hypothetical protein B0H14DRAFT_196403 [Mycena olivaceomarginata]
MELLSMSFPALLNPPFSLSWLLYIWLTHTAQCRLQHAAKSINTHPRNSCRVFLPGPRTVPTQPIALYGVLTHLRRRRNGKMIK